MIIPSRSVFEVISWEQTEYDTPAEGPSLGRATVRKRFTGDLEGDSVAEVLTCQPNEIGAGYVASERITGTIGHRSGTFVVQHGATQDGEHFHLFGHVVPESGTGDFTGMRGQATFRHNDDGAIFSLDYEFPSEESADEEVN